MRYIVVDLEATCWENIRDFERMETIEIGVVELSAADEPPSREFSRFIRPVAERELSDFCRRLTTIRQRDVDQADGFWAVFPEFLEWIGEEPFAAHGRNGRLLGYQITKHCTGAGPRRSF